MSCLTEHSSKDTATVKHLELKWLLDQSIQRSDAHQRGEDSVLFIIPNPVFLVVAIVSAFSGNAYPCVGRYRSLLRRC
jgi:hypothetical protein